MQTQNQQSLVIYLDDLKELIRSEVSKFREELAVYIGEHQKDKHLDEKPLDIQQVADRYNVSKQTVHNWMKQGLIKGFKQGKSRYFYLHELDKSLTRYDYKYFKILKDAGEIPKDMTHAQYLRER